MAAILQKMINKHISATVRPIVTKFGTVMQNGLLYHIGR